MLAGQTLPQRRPGPQVRPDNSGMLRTLLTDIGRIVSESAGEMANGYGALAALGSDEFDRIPRTGRMASEFPYDDTLRARGVPATIAVACAAARESRSPAFEQTGTIVLGLAVAR